MGFPHYSADANVITSLNSQGFQVFAYRLGSPQRQWLNVCHVVRNLNHANNDDFELLVFRNLLDRCFQNLLAPICQHWRSKSEIHASCHLIFCWGYTTGWQCDWWCWSDGCYWGRRRYRCGRHTSDGWWHNHRRHSRNNRRHSR